MEEKTRRILIATGVLVATTAMFFAGSFRTVNSGEVGVRVRFGKASNVPVREGVVLKLPLVERIVRMNMRVQKLAVETASSSKDLQEVEMTIAVNYKINYDSAIELYKTVGLNYEQIILQPAIEESIKAVTSRYTAEQLITQRSTVSKECMDELTLKVSKYGIEVSDFNITNFSFSEEFDRAIEEKQVAEQKVLTAKQELARDEIEAQKKIVKAQAEKEANELISQSLTPEILLQNAIEKWNGELPEYMGGDFGFTKMLK